MSSPKRGQSRQSPRQSPERDAECEGAPKGTPSPRTLEATIISVRKRSGQNDPPDLTGCSVKLKVVKRDDGSDRCKEPVQALLCIPDHVTPPNFEASKDAVDPPALPDVSTAQHSRDFNHEGPDLVDDIERGLNEPASRLESASKLSIDSLAEDNVPEHAERPCAHVGTDPSWANAMIKALENLHVHQKFRKTALRARRRYSSNWWLACRLAFWMLVIGGPVIVYPVAEFFNNWGSRSSKYMASYNMAMQNFCFLLGPSLGASVRYSLEGVIGTLLALGNVLLMNRAFGSYLNGGAFATRENVTDVGLGREIYASEWLPLCNLGTGERFVQTNSTAEFLRECFINVHWSSIDEGSLRSLIILADLTIFTGGFLWFGFGTCVRVYAAWICLFLFASCLFFFVTFFLHFSNLTWVVFQVHVFATEALIYLLYWAMAFVDPSSPAFSDDPSDPWTQSIMTCAGAFIACLSQLVPCKNDALTKATDLAGELAETVSAVLEALPFATRSEVNLAIELLGRISDSHIFDSFSSSLACVRRIVPVCHLTAKTCHCDL